MNEINEIDDIETERARKRVHRERLISRILMAVAGLLLVIFVTLSQVFAWGRVRTLEENINELKQTAAASQSQDDCLALYRNDVSAATGLAVAASNRLFYSALGRPVALTDEDRIAQAADNARLGKQLAASTEPLERASKALTDYDKLNPPPDQCPHPNSLSVAGG